MPRAQISCPGVPESVRTARAFAAATLAGWGAEEYEWPALLVVSELATNAVLHAHTAYEVHLILDADSLTIEARDGSPRAPARRRYGHEATTGRGMGLVTDVSTGWQVDLVQTGKIVRCALRRATQQHDNTDHHRLDIIGQVDLDKLLADFPDHDGDADAAEMGAGWGQAAA